MVSYNAFGNAFVCHDSFAFPNHRLLLFKPQKKKALLILLVAYYLEGSGKTLAEISTKRFTPEDVNFRLLILPL